MKSEMVCASEGDTPTTSITLKFKTMAYFQTLQQVKFVTAIQEAFGARRGVYDADSMRESGRLDEQNSESRFTTGWKTDALHLETNEKEAGQVLWDMDSGNFYQRFDHPSQRPYSAKLLNFEELQASSNANTSFVVLGNDDAHDVIRTGALNDVVNGRGGHDLIHTNKGDDFIIGSEGVDQVWTGAGKDVVSVSAGNGFALIRDFEAGMDRLDIAGGTADVSIRQLGQSGTDNNLADHLSAVRHWGPTFENQLVGAGLIYKGEDLIAAIQTNDVGQLVVTSEGVAGMI